MWETETDSSSIEIKRPIYDPDFTKRSYLSSDLSLAPANQLARFIYTTEQIGKARMKIGKPNF